MALYQQFKSLFQLPGVQNRANEAAAQAARVRDLLEKRRGFSPAPTPATPVSPAVSAPGATAQIDAIRAALSGIETGAKKLQETAQAPGFAPKPTPQADTLTPIMTKMTTNQAPSQEEEQLRTKLSNLLSSRDLGLIEAEKQAIPLQAIIGEQGRIEKRAAVQAGTLQEQLAQAQARRQAALEGAKTEFEFEKEKHARQVPKLTEVSPGAALYNSQTGKLEYQAPFKEQPASASEKTRTLQTQAIGVARPLLIAARGRDGYVNSATYLKLRNDYAEAIGDPTSFDRVFGPMLSPAERQRLGVGRVITTAQDIGDVLAQYLGGS